MSLRRRGRRGDLLDQKRVLFRPMNTVRRQIDTVLAQPNERTDRRRRPTGTLLLLLFIFVLLVVVVLPVVSLVVGRRRRRWRWLVVLVLVPLGDIVKSVADAVVVGGEGVVGGRSILRPPERTEIVALGKQQTVGQRRDRRVRPGHDQQVSARDETSEG